jgi:hypothetical protein
MARRRLVAVLLVVSLALVPLHAAAQAPPAAPAALAALFPTDTVGYLELQLRPGGDQGPRLERLLRLLSDAAPDEEQWGWVRLVPRVARALAVGVWLRGEEVGVMGAVAADDPGALLSLVVRAQDGSAPAEPYGDVSILQVGRAGRGYAAAVGSYLLAANDRAALVATIDRVRAGVSAGPGLAAAPRYQAAAGRLPATRFVTAYLDGGGLAGWLDQFAAREGAAPDERPSGRPPGTPPSDGSGIPLPMAPFLGINQTVPGLPGASPPAGAPSPAVPGSLADRPAPRGPSTSTYAFPAMTPGFSGLAGMGRLFSQGFASSGRDLPEDLNRLRQGSLAAGVTAAPDGLRFVLESPAAWQETPQPRSTGEALRFVPAGALFAASGHDLAAAARPTLAEMGESLSAMLPPGTDLQADVLAWMDGEYGFALLASPISRGGAMGGFPEVVALFEVRDPPAVEGKLRDLVRRVAAAARLPSPEPIEERQGDVLVRRLPLAEDVSLTWGYLGRWLFLTTGSSATLVQAAAAGGLPASPAYTRLTRGLPTPNSNVYYADLAGFVGWIGALMGDRSPLSGADAARWRDLLGLLGGAAAANGLARDGWLETIAVLEVRW